MQKRVVPDWTDFAVAKKTGKRQVSKNIGNDGCIVIFTAK
jgi:hypothetical protein